MPQRHDRAFNTQDSCYFAQTNLPCILAWFVLIAIMCRFTTAYAESFWNSTQFHGFGTLGAAINDQANVAEVRDLENNIGIVHRGDYWAADSRLGLQIDQPLTKRLTATVQVVGAHRVIQRANNTVQWAFLRLNASPEWTLRAGRLGVDAFMLSDQRNVGFSYLWVRPPVEFYGYIPLYSMDGGDVEFTHTLGDGTMSVKAYAGESRPTYFIKNNTPDYTEFLMKPILGVDLGWRYSAWTLRLEGVSLLIHNNFADLNTLLQASSALAAYAPFLGSAAQNASENGTHIYYYGEGVNFDNGHLVMLSELSATQFQSHFKANTAQGYLTLGLHISDFTPFISYSRVWETRNDIQINQTQSPLPPQLAASVNQVTTLYNQGVFDLTKSNQYTFSLGNRWDFANNMDLKIQYDLTRVQDASYLFWTNTSGQLPRAKGVSMLSLTLDAVF